MVQWQLPDIADLDDVQLVTVLRNINRWTADGRLKAAQSPVTRSYLQAGLRLLAQTVMPTPETGEDPQIHPLVDFISRRKVVDEVSKEDNADLPRRGSVGGLRDLWDPHRGFLMDLLRTSLLIDSWVNAVSGSTVEQLRGIDDPLELVQEVALANSLAVAGDAGFRIQLLATIIAAQEPELHETLDVMYETLSRSWAEVYEAVMRSWGMKLREGITAEMLANMLMGLAQGLAVRQIGAPDPRILDEDRRTSLLATGAMAILSSCLEPIDSNESFESSVRARLSGRSRADPG